MGFLKRFLIGLGITVGVIGITVGVVAIAFHDGGRSTFVPKENYNIEDVMKNAVAASLDNIKTTKKMDVKVTRDDLNQVFYMASSKLPDKAKEFVKALYVETSDDNYKFCVDLQAGFYKTRATIDTKLEETKIDDKDAYAFNIKSVKLGKVNGLNILKKYLINDSTMQGIFSGAGLSIKSNMDNNRLYYIKSDLKEDVIKLVGAKNDNSFLSPLITHFFDKDCIKIGFGEAGIGMDVDFSSAETNPTYIGDESDKQLNIPMEDIKTKVISGLNSNLFGLDKSELIYSLFLNGYNSLDDESKATVDAIDFSSINNGDSAASSIEGYNFVLEENEKIDNMVKTQGATNAPIAVAHPGEKTKIIEITENDLSKVLSSTSLLKKGYVFSSNDGTNNHFSYITVDNFYSQMIKNHMYFVAGININGFETRAIIDAAQDTTIESKFKVGFKVEHVFLGNIDASDGFKDIINTLIKDAVDGMDSSVLKYDDNTKTVIFDLEETLFSIPSIGTVLEGAGDAEISLSDVELDSTGAFNVYYTFASL